MSKVYVSNVKSEYSILYRKWLAERESDTIQPLEYDYNSRLYTLLKKNESFSQQMDSIESVIFTRFIRLLEDLRQIRWTKLINGILRNFNIDSSLLAKQEIEIWNHFKSIQIYYSQIPFNNIKNLSPNKDIETSANPLIDDGNITSLVQVRFLQKVNSFLGPDLSIYGPFEPEDIAMVPKTVAFYVLLPKKMVELINKDE